MPCYGNQEILNHSLKMKIHCRASGVPADQQLQRLLQQVRAGKKLLFERGNYA